MILLSWFRICALLSVCLPARSMFAEIKWMLVMIAELMWWFVFGILAAHSFESNWENLLPFPFDFYLYSKSHLVSFARNCFDVILIFTVQKKWISISLWVFIIRRSGLNFFDANIHIIFELKINIDHNTAASSALINTNQIIITYLYGN